MDTKLARRRSLGRWALALAAAVMAVVAFGVMGLTGGTAATQADTAIDTEEQAFMDLLNDYRAQNQLGPIIIDPSLQNAAEWMSTDMGVENYFSHDDSTGRDPWERLCDFNYCHNTWKGENIAAGYTLGADVFRGWRESPGHNSNMLGSHYVVMGLARVQTQGSTYGWYWTNDFGGLQVEPSPPPAPTNTPTASATQSPTSSPTPEPTATPTPTASPSPAPTTPRITKTPDLTTTPTPRRTAKPEEAAGDVDCDAAVTGLDSLRLLRFLTGVDTADETCPPLGASDVSAEGIPARGDVDCSGTLSGADALRILRYTAGWPEAILSIC